MCEKSFAACQQSKMADVRGTPDRRAHFTARVVFAVWRAQQDDDSTEKRSSSSRITLDLEDDGSTRQQQDSEAATLSKTSKATDDQPSRFHV